MTPAIEMLILPFDFLHHCIKSIRYQKKRHLFKRFIRPTEVTIFDGFQSSARIAKMNCLLYENRCKKALLQILICLFSVDSPTHRQQKNWRNRSGFLGQFFLMVSQLRAGYLTVFTILAGFIKSLTAS